MNPVVSKIQTLGKQVVPKDSRLVLFGSRARGDFRIEKARRAFIHLFGQHFVQPGIVDVKDGKFYNATGAEVK